MRIGVVGLVDPSWGGAYSAQQLAFTEFLNALKQEDEVFVHGEGWLDFEAYNGLKTLQFNKNAPGKKEKNMLEDDRNTQATEKFEVIGTTLISKTKTPVKTKIGTITKKSPKLHKFLARSIILFNAYRFSCVKLGRAIKKRIAQFATIVFIAITPKLNSNLIRRARTLVLKGMQGNKFWIIQKRRSNYVYGIEEEFKSLKIDLVYFIGSPHYQKEFSQIPYISTIWDLGHRDFPSLPELSKDREFEIREEALGIAFRKSIAILVESTQLKIKLRELYGIDPERIFVNKFAPYGPLIFREFQYTLQDFIYYPAQFWPHKNHLILLKAMSNLQRKGLVPRKLVLTGLDKRNLDHVMDQAKALEVSDSIIFLGFTEPLTVRNLYKNAAALAMPSLLGPTNLPPLEALSEGCPVFVSQEGSFELLEFDGVTILSGFKIEEWETVFNPRNIHKRPEIEKCNNLIKLRRESNTKNIIEILERERYLQELHKG
jgi:glycosyltransferase involved in cell wall biosynthesis